MFKEREMKNDLKVETSNTILPLAVRCGPSQKALQLYCILVIQGAKEVHYHGANRMFVDM